MKGQPTLWDIDEPLPSYGATKFQDLPGDYPWRYYERYQFHLAKGTSPPVAAVLAEQDVVNETAAAEREQRRRCPTLFDEAEQIERIKKERPRLHVA